MIDAEQESHARDVVHQWMQRGVDVDRIECRIYRSDSGCVAYAVAKPSLELAADDPIEALSELLQLIARGAAACPLPDPEPADVPDRYLITEGHRVYGVHEGTIAMDENRRGWTLREGRWVADDV